MFIDKFSEDNDAEQASGWQANAPVFESRRLHSFESVPIVSSFHNEISDELFNYNLARPELKRRVLTAGLW